MWCAAKKFVIEAKNEVWVMLLYTKKLCWNVTKGCCNIKTVTHP